MPARDLYDEWDDDEEEVEEEEPLPAPRRPRRPSSRPPGGAPKRRSHAAIPLALVVFLVGILLGPYSILIPALLGIGLVYVSLSFLSSRLNPFSLSFYLTVKPSWLSIGTLALVGIGLVGLAYGYYVSGVGPIAPGVPHLP